MAEIWPCPLSTSTWPWRKFRPARHRSHPWPNWLKWYSIITDKGLPNFLIQEIYFTPGIVHISSFRVSSCLMSLSFSVSTGHVSRSFERVIFEISCPYWIYFLADRTRISCTSLCSNIVVGGSWCDGLGHFPWCHDDVGGVWRYWPPFGLSTFIPMSLPRMQVSTVLSPDRYLVRIDKVLETSDKSDGFCNMLMPN